MDVISLGLANKAAVIEKEMRDKTLSDGVQGQYKSTKERIDSLEDTFGGIVKKANELILTDAVNIMKANAKLNTVANSMKYEMYNMVFDDLLDLSGLDLEKSYGYNHDDFEGSLIVKADSDIDILLSKKWATVTTLESESGTIPENAVLSVEEESTIIIDETPVMSSNLIPSPYVVASSSAYSGDFQAWKAFNGDAGSPNSRWISKAGYTSGWISVDLSAPTKINAYSIQQIETTSVSDHTSMPKSWRFFGSEDGVSWEKLDERFDEEDWKSGEGRLYSLYEDAEYQFYKLEVADNNGNASILTIPEFKVLRKETVSLGSKGIYSVTRDNGETWQEIKPNELFYFNDNISGKGTTVRLKIELPVGSKLLNYGLTWS